MTSARVGLDRGEVVCHFGSVFLAVEPGTEESTLFAHPRHDSDRAVWPKMLLVKQMGGCHRNRSAGAIIKGTGSEVP
jgi:hypothetical protein